jgi:Uma2 family endonuclease
MSAEQAARPLREYLTPEAYLEGERHSEVRHEYFEGGVHAMADASAEHEFIALNFAAALLAHLKGKPCRVFKDGMKLKLQAMGRDIFCYPDIMVACDPADNHRYYREKPRLLIEVLSEDENKDLIEKFFAYQRLPSLEEYVVVRPDPAKPEVRIFRRAERWEPGETHQEGEFTLHSVDLTLKVADLYAA